MKGSGLLKFILWAAACLLLAVSPGFSFAQAPPLPQKVGVLELEDLIARAEKEGWNLMVVPGGSYTYYHRTGYLQRRLKEITDAGGVEQWLAGMKEWAREPEKAWLLGLAQPARQVGAVVWLGVTEPGEGSLGAEGGDSEVVGDLMAVYWEAARTLCKALIASLDAEQMDLLLHRHTAEQVVTLYRSLPPVSEEWPADAVRRLEMGGSLAGSKMTDFQRRLCGLAVCTYHPDLRPEWLATAQYAYAACYGKAIVQRKKPGGGSPPEETYTVAGRDGVALVVQCGPVEVDPSLRSARARRDWVHVDVQLPLDRFEGKALEDLVEWAKANQRPGVEEMPQEIAPPVFRHTTDGPTKDVTSLLTPEEAEIYVEVPSDVIYTQRAVAAMFQVMGITVTGATELTMEPIPAGPKGEPERYTLCQLLNYIIRDSSRNGYFVREGNTFRLVEEWEITGRYCLNPIPYLPAEGLDRPVTIAMKKGTLADFLQALREQTGLALYAGRAAETCGVPISAVVKGVPAREILAPLTRYLSGGWERLSDGKLSLVPLGYLQVMYGSWRVTTSEEIEQHCQKMARMTLALFVEALSPAHQRRLREEGLTFGELTGPARELSVAAAQLAFGTRNPDKEAIAVKALGQEQDGSWEIRVWLGSAYKDFVTIAVPTIPPNPTPRVRTVPRRAPPQRRVIDVTGVR